LNSCSDFNLYDAFRYIDVDARSFIDAYDILKAFRDPNNLDLG